MSREERRAQKKQAKAKAPGAEDDEEDGEALESNTNRAGARAMKLTAIADAAPSRRERCELLPTPHAICSSIGYRIFYAFVPSWRPPRSRDESDARLVRRARRKKPRTATGSCTHRARPMRRRATSLALLRSEPSARLPQRNARPKPMVCSLCVSCPGQPADEPAISQSGGNRGKEEGTGERPTRVVWDDALIA
jgi:hypothetical protein